MSWPGSDSLLALRRRESSAKTCDWGVAHALHERKLRVRGQGVEVLHDMAKVCVWDVGIVSTGECALALLADLHGCRCWRSEAGLLRNACRGVALLRRMAVRGSNSPALNRKRSGGGAWAGRRASCREVGDLPCLWRSDRRGLGRLMGEENGDLRLDKGLALRPVAELGVEGLHSGAEVRPH